MSRWTDVTEKSLCIFHTFLGFWNRHSVWEIKSYRVIGPDSSRQTARIYCKDENTPFELQQETELVIRCEVET